jgi:hypothetical protein
MNNAGKTPDTPTSMLMPDLENGRVRDNTNRAWDWLFGVFYNREPVFDDTSLATVLSCVVALIECAESVGSINHVRDVVDLALLRQDNVLWTSILGNPHVWIELGRRIRSPSIYSEAAIHLIGQWGQIRGEEKARISGDIRAILERKADELSLVKEAIELRILGHYPEFLRRAAEDKPGRPSYGADIYMWMCVSFFRQWFAQNISDDRTRRAPDGGLAFYTALYDGGQEYLSHLDFAEFHKYFPMSIKACHVLEANMGVLKEDIKRFVEDLLKERTHLRRAHHDIYWLTCAEIVKEDMPWNQPETPKTTASGTFQTTEVEFDENGMADDDAAARAYAAAHATTPHGRKTARVSDGSVSSGRPKKRTRVNADLGDEDPFASGAESLPDSNASTGMFVGPGDDGM